MARRGETLSRALLSGYFWLLVAYLMFPIFIVIPISFSESQFLEFPPSELGLRWYHAYVEDPVWVAATFLSLRVALMASLLATLVGTMAVIVLERRAFRLKALLVTAITSPIIIPHIFIALGVFILAVRLGFDDSSLALVGAHATIALPFVVLIVGAAARQLDPTLERAARVLSYLASAMAIAPAAGPVIGGFLESYLGWRSNFFALSLYALVLLLLLGYRLPETNRYRDETALRPMRIVGNYVLLLRHRSYLGYLLIVALAYSGIFVFISGSSFLLIETLGLTPQAFGLSFAGAVGGYVVGSLGSGRFSQRFGSDRILVFGVAMGCLAGTVGLTLALSGVLSVVSVVGSTALFFLAAGCLLPNAFAGALRHYPHMAGSASSLLGFVQMALASAIGMAVGALHDGTHLPMAGATALIAAAIAASWAFLIRPGLVQDRLRQAA